jgi:hypothetical protein
MYVRYGVDPYCSVVCTVCVHHDLDYLVLPSYVGMRVGYLLEGKCAYVLWLATPDWSISTQDSPTPQCPLGRNVAIAQFISQFIAPFQCRYIT